MGMVINIFLFFVPGHIYIVISAEKLLSQVVVHVSMCRQCKVRCINVDSMYYVAASTSITTFPSPRGRTRE